MKPDVSVVTPAFNEEGNLEEAVKNVVNSIKDCTSDYEIIVVDDGSTDATGRLAEKLASKNKKIKVLHNRKNMGIGYAFKRAVKIASKSYMTVFPGDNDMSVDSLRKLITVCSQADIITAYLTQTSCRSYLRVFLSCTFVFLMNLLFGLRLRYYNGPFICRLSILKPINLISDGFTIYAEVKVRLIKAGYSFKEIPFAHIGRKYGQSKALTLKSLLNTLKTVLLVKNNYSA